MTDVNRDRTAGGIEPSRDGVVVRRSGQGWQVGNEEASDLTSAMVLADLFAAEAGEPAPAPARPSRSQPVSEEDEAARLAVTVTQLEHALASRVRVEQAIGVLAERHRLRPRSAFDLLRSVARSSGRRVTAVAEDVVESSHQPAAAAAGRTGQNRAPAPQARPLSPPRPGRQLTRINRQLASPRLPPLLPVAGARWYGGGQPP